MRPSTFYFGVSIAVGYLEFLAASIYVQTTSHRRQRDETAERRNTLYSMYRTFNIPNTLVVVFIQQLSFNTSKILFKKGQDWHYKM